MNSHGKLSKAKQFLADIPGVIGFALPYIIAGGVLGAMLGNVVGSTANGFRVGVVIGGAIAFAGLLRKEKRRP